MFTINDGHRKRISVYPFNKKGEKVNRHSVFREGDVQFFSFDEQYFIVYFEEIISEELLIKFIDSSRHTIVPGESLPIAFFVFERKRNHEVVVGEIWFRYPNIYALQPDLSRMELELKQIMRGEKVSAPLQRYWGKFVHVIEYLQKITDRFPQHYDYDIFSLKEQLFAMVSQKFLRERGSRYLGLFIRYFYDFFHSIEEETAPEIRTKVTILQVFGEMQTQQVLGVFIALRADEEEHLVTEKTIINGVQQRLRKVQVVNESYFELKGSRGKVCYCEIRRGKTGVFSSKEVVDLQRGFISAIQSWKKEAASSFCVPRNQEELSKQLHVLSKEIHTPEDIPQLMVCFDRQSSQGVMFLVLVVIPFRDGMQKLMLDSSETVVEMERDFIDQGLKKRSWIIKVNLPISPIKREREFYQARKQVLKKIEPYFSQYRDYNGGMIEKQEAAYQAFALACQQEGIYKEALCEQFFYGIQSDYMRTLFTEVSLVCWYKMFVSFLYRNKKKAIKSEKKAIFFVTQKKIPKSSWDEILKDFGVSPSQWGYFSANFFGEWIHGLLFFSIPEVLFEGVNRAFCEKGVLLNL